MRGEMVKESWFSNHNLWRASRKSMLLELEKGVIGILAFEVVNLMSKVVSLWKCLSDKQIVRLREEIVNSLGTQKLVSDDHEYLMDLALAEIIEKIVYVAKSAARLGKRCADPVYHCLEHVFDDPVEIHLNWRGWEYRLKKMERKVKKMERFIDATAQLHQEMEILAELEQSLRRMQVSADLSHEKLLEFQQKIPWQRQKVKNLREMSPWVRMYDRTVRLLLRSLFTIVKRIKHVFDINQLKSIKEHNNCDRLLRNHSTSACMQSSVHPSENELSEFDSGPIGRSVSNLGLSADKIKTNVKKWKAHHQPSILCENPCRLRTRRLEDFVPFKGCLAGGNGTPVLKTSTLTSGDYLKSGVLSNDAEKVKYTNMVPLSSRNMINSKAPLFDSKRKLLNGPPSTLGGSALALRYAHVILLIEKLASSPHLISLDVRDDLYNFLPLGVRISLRSKLKLFDRPMASSVYDASVAAECGLNLAKTLEWLAPLAYNMIMWHSVRNFEKQRMGTGTNVFLVQTLYFANKVKTEAAIIELLMGLNSHLRCRGK